MNTLPVLDRVAVESLITQGLGLGSQGGFQVVSVVEGGATVEFAFKPWMLRPGGTVSGPALMLAADAAMYAAILGHYGAKEMAVTSNFNIHFLHRPQPEAITAVATLIKAGRRLATLTVDLYTAGQRVAYATGSYALPSA